MIMEKIIISIEDDIKTATAINAVKIVVADGKVSEDTKGRKYYCWATTFNTDEGKIIVFTKQTRREGLASFRVLKEKGVRK